MLLLVTIAHGQIVEYQHMGGLGRMVQPRHYPKDNPVDNPVDNFIGRDARKGLALHDRLGRRPHI